MILEQLDRMGGSVDVDELAYQLERRGHEFDEEQLSELLGQELIERRGEAVALTDRGAASIEGPVPEAAQHRASSNGTGTVKDRILGLLRQHPDGVRAMEIHRHLGLSQGSVATPLSQLWRSGDVEKRRCGQGAHAGVLYFIADQAPPPDASAKATTSPTVPVKRPAKAVEPPPPSEPADLERYLGLLGQVAMIEAPPADVLDRLERVLELDAKVRGDG